MSHRQLAVDWPSADPRGPGARQVQWIGRHHNLHAALVAYGMPLEQALELKAHAKKTRQVRFELTAQSGPATSCTYPARIVIVWRIRGWYADAYQVLVDPGEPA